MSTTPRTYPQGVTCWIDTEQPDPLAAAAFYGELLGWEFTNAMPPDAPSVYLIASLDGLDAAAIGPAEPDAAARWNTYLAVDDVDATTTALADAGASIDSPPQEAGPGGRTASLTDPQGAPFRLWQARKRLGAQAVNVPGAWNFSDLRTTDVPAARGFYGEAFGWRYHDLGDGAAGMIAVPGYGDHLEATADPHIRDRQAGAPPEFADVIGSLVPVGPGETPRWEVKISVASRADAMATADRLGATVLSTEDTPWALLARIRDPWGADLTLSEYLDPR